MMQLRYLSSGVLETNDHSIIFRKITDNPNGIKRTFWTAEVLGQEFLTSFPTLRHAVKHVWKYMLHATQTKLITDKVWNG